jgi:fatty acid desaturase
VVETLRIRKNLAREASKEFAALTRSDGRKRAAELAVFVALAGAGLWLSIHARSASSAPLLVVGILVTAIALNTFPLLMHEGMHGVLFVNRRWNWMASVLLGSTFLMSFSAYRVMHLRHHRYLGDPRDPDDYHNYSRSRYLVWCLHFVRLTAGPLLYLGLIPVLALKHGSLAQRKLIGIEYLFLASIYGALLRMFSYRELFVVWFVPLLVMGALTALRSVPGQPDHASQSGRRVLPSERELPPGAPSVSRSAQLPPAGTARADLAHVATRRLGPELSGVSRRVPQGHAAHG